MIFVFSDLVVRYEKEFCSELRIPLKNATMFKNQDMFENGKPDILI